jgi:hypothetical protein
LVALLRFCNDAIATSTLRRALVAGVLEAEYAGLLAKAGRDRGTGSRQRARAGARGGAFASTQPRTARNCRADVPIAAAFAPWCNRTACRT